MKMEDHLTTVEITNTNSMIAVIDTTMDTATMNYRRQEVKAEAAHQF